MGSVALQPRIIRAGQAPGYCGMCRAEFDKHIRPYLKEIKIGVQGIGFDRIEIDQALDDYIARYSQSPKAVKGDESCKNVKGPRLVSSSSTVSGGSTRLSTEKGFAEALARAKGKKPKDS